MFRVIYYTDKEEKTVSPIQSWKVANNILQGVLRCKDVTGGTIHEYIKKVGWVLCEDDPSQCVDSF